MVRLLVLLQRMMSLRKLPDDYAVKQHIDGKARGESGTKRPAAHVRLHERTGQRQVLACIDRD